jgi:23S rRNA-intervening sequence protein
VTSQAPFREALSENKTGPCDYLADLVAASIGEDWILLNMSFLFEKLEVYQRAVNLAARVTVLTKSFPAQGHYHLVDQLRRASLSISLNIAEGNGR